MFEFSSLASVVNKGARYFIGAIGGYVPLLRDEIHPSCCGLWSLWDKVCVVGSSSWAIRRVYLRLRGSAALGGKRQPCV